MTSNFSFQWNVKDDELLCQLRDFREYFPSAYVTFKESVFLEVVELSKKYMEEMKNASD